MWIWDGIHEITVSIEEDLAKAIMEQKVDDLDRVASRMKDFKDDIGRLREHAKTLREKKKAKKEKRAKKAREAKEARNRAR